MTRKKTINIRDLFVEPNFHELEVDRDDDEKYDKIVQQAVATDSKGEPRKLNPAQLESIRQTGQFQVGYFTPGIVAMETLHPGEMANLGVYWEEGAINPASLGRLHP